ncbi:hypothetical protein SXCC_04352 [Gluconacetobacter sp. SXCC-1]|nr:hypothetical protein SXCC_04352 [Gluconacetobacter sp. SXCC-1]
MGVWWLPDPRMLRPCTRYVTRQEDIENPLTDSAFEGFD